MDDPVQKDRPIVDLFTDGACLGNPGPGGWGYLLRHPASGRELHDSGCDPLTTNNRMEILAAIHGLEALKVPSTVRLYSDSKYLVDAMTSWIFGWHRNGWKRSPKASEQVKNADLWPQVWTLMQRHEVHPRWVRGHDGHRENELCDRLASAAAQRASRMPPPPQRPGPARGLFSD
jgi:ribonuclease HI